MADTPQEIVERELREFKRYTGDGLPGEPVNAPLPVGDPQSGVHNPKKVNLRKAMLAPLEEAAQSASEAEGFRDEAAVIVANADLALQRYVPVDVADVSGGDPATAYEPGDEIDGVELVAGWTVLRATPEGDPDDGIYVVPATGAAPRADLFNTYDSLAGAAIRVMRGGDYANTDWRVNSVPGGTLGVTDILVEQLSSASDAADITYTAPLSGAVFRTLRSRLGERVSIRDFGGRDDGDTDNTPIMDDLADAIGYQGTIYMPRVEGGSYQFHSPCAPFTGPVKLTGDGVWRTVVAPIGFTSGHALFEWYRGAPDLYIYGAGATGLMAFGDGNATMFRPRYCVRSEFSDCWAEGMQSAIRADWCWSNNYNRIITNNNVLYGIELTGENQQINIENCIFDGAYAGARGILASGVGSVINIKGCSFEGFGTVSSNNAHGIRLEPSGAGMFNINIENNYFENITGVGVSAAGPSGLLRCLRIVGNRFWGGYPFWGSQAGYADHAIYLQHANAVEILTNTFQTLGSYGLYSAGNNNTGLMARNVFSNSIAIWNNVGDTNFTVTENLALAIA